MAAPTQVYETSLRCRLKRTQRDVLERMAKKLGVTSSDLLREAIAEYCAKAG